MESLVRAASPSTATADLTFSFVPSLEQARGAGKNEKLKAFLNVHGPAIHNSLTDARAVLDQHLKQITSTASKDKGQVQQ